MRRTKAAIILSILFCFAVVLPLLLSPAKAVTYPYVASKSSKVYHMIECGQAVNILESNRVYFATRSAAEASGRRPCSYCGDGIVDEGNGSGNSSSNGSSSNNGSTDTKIIYKTNTVTENIPVPYIPQWVWWVIVILLAVIIATILIFRYKIRETTASNQRQFEQTTAHFHDCLSYLHSRLSLKFGENYLYKIAGAQSGDRLGLDGLPFSNDGSPHKWGSKYTVYLSPSVHSHTYHRPSCPNASRLAPLNVYRTVEHRLTYSPCKRCNPSPPNMDWIPRYHRLSVFLSKHNISINHNPPAPPVTWYDEPIYYMESNDGMLVRVPESKVEPWQVEQDRQRRGEPIDPQQAEFQQNLCKKLVQDIYGVNHDASGRE